MQDDHYLTYAASCWANYTCAKPALIFGTAKTNRLPRGSLHNFAGCKFKSFLREIEVEWHVQPMCPQLV